MVLSVFISYFYKEVLLYIFVKPCLLYHNLDTNFYFIYTNLTEIMNMYIKIILFVSSQLTCILLAYHLRTFIKPGLYYKENKIIDGITKYAFVILTTFILLMYYKIIPYSWNFFTNISTTPFQLYFEAKLTEYLNFFFSIYYVAVINSQLFIILVLFLKTSKNYVREIKQKRKIFYFIIFTLSAIITPPDVNSLILLSFMAISFLEIIIITLLTSRYFCKKGYNFKKVNN